MARLIVKAPYMKGGRGGGYLKYIGTREGVELLPQSEIYMKYINERPRSHGLFGDEEHVNLKNAITEVENYTGNIWTPIISLKREDAIRYGYDNAEAWRNLLRAHRNEIAEAFKIPPNDFRWYAAFHDEGEHPHVHMMVWSAKPGQAYLSKQGIEKIKSVLTNDIFAHEMVPIYEQKSEMRDELVREARHELRELCSQLRNHIFIDDATETMMSELVSALPGHGKMSYGYLPKRVKKLVDEIVDRLAQFDTVRECYDKWQNLQWQVESFYHDKPKEKKRLSEQKEFRQIKNAIISEAVQIREHRPTFEDEELEGADEYDAMDGAPYQATELWYVLNDEGLPFSERDKYVDTMRCKAEQGDRFAQYAMGILYRDGPLVTPDLQESEYWLRLSAEQGYPQTMYALGKLYLDRDSWIFDYSKGMRWLIEAASNGHDYAAYRLGKEYLLTGDTKQAEHWFNEVDKLNNPYAAYQLGKMYFTHNPKLSGHYLTRSADAGNSYAQYLLNRVNEPKPPSILLAATKLLHHLSNIIEQRITQDSTGMHRHIDQKRRRQLMEKRLAMGHKPDDHEEPQQSQGWDMTMPGW